MRTKSLKRARWIGFCWYFHEYTQLWNLWWWKIYYAFYVYYRLHKRWSQAPPCPARTVQNYRLTITFRDCTQSITTPDCSCSQRVAGGETDRSGNVFPGVALTPMHISPTITYNLIPRFSALLWSDVHSRKTNAARLSISMTSSNSYPYSFHNSWLWQVHWWNRKFVILSSSTFSSAVMCNVCRSAEPSLSSLYKHLIFPCSQLVGNNVCTNLIHKCPA